MQPHPDWLVASGSLPPGVPDDFYAQLTRLGARCGMRVIIDTSGLPLRDAVQYGIAASAACVMTPGTELCRLADTERVYQRVHVTE